MRGRGLLILWLLDIFRLMVLLVLGILRWVLKGFHPAGHWKCHESQMERMVQNEHSGFLLGSAHSSEITICMDYSSPVNSCLHWMVLLHNTNFLNLLSTLDITWCHLPFSRPAMKPVENDPASSAAAKTTTASLGSDLGLEPGMYWLAYLPAYSLRALAGCSWFDNKGSKSAIILWRCWWVIGDGLVGVLFGGDSCRNVSLRLPEINLPGAWVFPFRWSDCQTVFWEARETEKLICVNWHFTILNDWLNSGATTHLSSILTIRRKSIVYKGMRMTTSTPATQVPTCIYHSRRCHLNHTSPCTSGSTLNSPHRLKCQILSLLLSLVSPVVVMRSMGSLTIGHWKCIIQGQWFTAASISNGPWTLQPKIFNEPWVVVRWYPWNLLPWWVLVWHFENQKIVNMLLLGGQTIQSNLIHRIPAFFRKPCDSFQQCRTLFNLNRTFLRTIFPEHHHSISCQPNIS